VLYAVKYVDDDPESTRALVFTTLFRQSESRMGETTRSGTSHR
jgi:hypothetical protein